MKIGYGRATVTGYRIASMRAPRGDSPAESAFWASDRLFRLEGGMMRRNFNGHPATAGEGEGVGYIPPESGIEAGSQETLLFMLVA